MSRSLFSLALILLTVLFVGASYMRFMVLEDYSVEYEGACDPYVDICFIGCEDEECTENYYYTFVTKYAPDLRAQCGPDITDCEAANICLPEDDDRCSILFCDPESDGEACENIDESIENDTGP